MANTLTTGFTLALLALSAGATVQAQSDGPKKPPRSSDITAIPAEAKGWLAVPRLLQGARSPDRAIAASATVRASRIAHELDLVAIETYEISRAERVSQRDAWLALASQSARWLDLRIAALDVAVAIERTLPEKRRLAAAAWLPLASDAEAGMQAAAVSQAPFSQALSERLRGLALEASEQLAVASAARFCRDAPESDVQNASPQLLQRIAELASMASLAIASRSDLVRCLVRDNTPSSRKAIRTILSQSPPSLRRQLVQLAPTSPPSPQPALP